RCGEGSKKNPQPGFSPPRSPGCATHRHAAPALSVRTPRAPAGCAALTSNPPTISHTPKRRIPPLWPIPREGATRPVTDRPSSDRPSSPSQARTGGVSPAPIFSFPRVHGIASPSVSSYEFYFQTLAGGGTLATQGWCGMQHFVEPRIRALVADHLGVRPEELTAEVSLVDDLAADSLDMIELAIAVEDALDISIPERTIEHVRSFGDLVEIIAQGLSRRREAEFLEQAPVLLARARLIPRESRRHRALDRSVWLTP